MSSPKKDKVLAIIGTLLIHGGVVLALFLMAFHTPEPQPSEEGVEVDLGMYNQGMGQVQPDNPAIPEPTTPPEIPQEEEPTESEEEEVVTQETEEAPAIEPEKKEPPKKEIEPKPKEEPVKPKEPEEPVQPTSNPRALFQGKKDPQPGGSEGITGQPGDQGKPNGIKDVKKYDGQGGQGNGISYDLGGRGHKSLARREMDDLPDEGTIVVDIWVNPSGKVIRAKAGAKGTTVSNSNMRKIAEELALASVFDSMKDAPPEQHGTITYTFKPKTSNQQ